MKSKRATLWQEDEHRNAGQRVPRPQPLPQPHAVPVSLLCLPWGSPPWTWPQTVGPSFQASPFSSSSSSVSTERAFTVREIQLIHSKKSIFSPDLLSFTAQIACRANDQNQQFFDLNVKISCWRPVLRGWSECVGCVGGGGGGGGGTRNVFCFCELAVCCQSILIVWSSSSSPQVGHKSAVFFQLCSPQSQFTPRFSTAPTYQPTFDFFISNFCEILPFYGLALCPPVADLTSFYDFIIQKSFWIKVI